MPKSPVTELIINQEHRNNHHIGTQATLYAVRLRYWLIDGRSQMWRTIKRCIRCCRANPPPVEYLIAFVHERDGIDYCGPFYIKERGDRNRRKIKIYAAISVCLETKAVHIQLVSDLTTGAFLAAHVDSSRGEDTAQPFLPTMTPISSGPTESCKNSGSYCSPTTTRRGYRIFSPTDRYNGVSILQTHHTLAIYGKPR